MELENEWNVFDWYGASKAIEDSFNKQIELLEKEVDELRRKKEKEGRLNISLLQ